MRRYRGTTRGAQPTPLGSKLSAHILLVDDNAAVRKTIRSFLSWHDFRVCGEAKNGKEAIHQVRELKPDIVLLDINMPGMNGIQIASKIRRVASETKIVFLTVHNTPGTRNAAQMWGHAFVAKSAASTELIPMLIRVAAGEWPGPTVERAPMF
jgi:DNA-binding NarL/FixJ family response regulator